MSNTKLKELEEEARRFLDQRSKESDPDKIRNELIEILEKFLTQLKK